MQRYADRPTHLRMLGGSTVVRVTCHGAGRASAPNPCYGRSRDGGATITTPAAVVRAATCVQCSWRGDSRQRRSALPRTALTALLLHSYTASTPAPALPPQHQHYSTTTTTTTTAPPLPPPLQHHHQHYHHSTTTTTTAPALQHHNQHQHYHHQDHHSSKITALPPTWQFSSSKITTTPPQQQQDNNNATTAAAR